jgi:penicillin amidase
MKSWIKKLLIVILFLLLTASLGLYLGVKNTMDYNSTEIVLDEIGADVKVYRDDKGIPTIIAENEDDLFFAQGYEMARDRLWQMHFMRAAGKGELANLIGDDYIEIDRYLRTLSMNYAADVIYDTYNSSHKNMLENFVAGINKYIELHENPPLEFLALQAKPTPWVAKDVLIIQGVMSQDLSLGALNREIMREDLARSIGVKMTQDIFPIEYQPAADYFLSLNYTASSLQTPALLSSTPVEGIDRMHELLGEILYSFDVGSNNWVVSGDLTLNGNPLVVNDPHLGLSTPGIWWQVQLVCPTYHVQGFSLPGVPGIIIGHNDKVAWGVTNTGTDALDVFYFKTNDQDQYYYDGQWLEFEIDTQQIPLKNDTTHEFEIKRTVYGPVMDHPFFNIDTDDTHVYVMRWTLFEQHERNKLMRAVYDINRAESVDEVHEALRYWSVPGQNIVFADVQGNIGYQYTGLTPIRSNNTYGVVPHNGSDGISGWDGFIDYEDHYYVKNPAKGYFYTANEQIDPTDNFYITDLYAIGYRGERIDEFLSNETIYPLTTQDMADLQEDTVNLYARDILTPFLDLFNNTVFDGDYAEELEEAVDYLNNWDLRMERSSVGATLFATFRIFLEEYTVRDELDAVNDTIFPRVASLSKHLIKDIANDKNNVWFDNITTTVVETGDDIALKALDSSVTYLTVLLGRSMRSWEWEEVHIAEFSHGIGSVLGFLNTGNKPSDGSSHTVMAGGSSPAWSEDGPQYDQGWGPSLRFIADVEDNWEDVKGILVPGASGHLLSKHYDDSIEDWIENDYWEWDFVTSIEDKPTFTFKKQE